MLFFEAGEIIVNSRLIAMVGGALKKLDWKKRNPNPSIFYGFPDGNFWQQ